MATTALHSPVTTPPGYTDTAKVRDMAALFRLRAKDAVSASTTARLCRLAVILHYRRTGDEMLDLDTSLIERESARRLASLGGSMPGLKKIPRRRLVP